VRILDTRVYVGPSQYAYFPVVRLTVDLGLLEAWPTGRLGPEFREGLLELLPGLCEHRCSWGVPGGFVRRMTEDRGTWLAHVLEHTAIELQCIAGHDVGYGRARETDASGVYCVVYQYRDRRLGEGAGALARDILVSLLPAELRSAMDLPADFDVRQQLEAWHELAQQRALGPSTAALVRAAEQRRIPWQRLDDDHLIQFGYGSRQRRVLATITSATSHIGVELASDKALTNTLLRHIGVPVPRQEVVASEAEAVAAAGRIGWPLVVKPRYGNHGRGVTPDIRTVSDVCAAFLRAHEHDGSVLVEEHIAGFDHRLLVVGDEVVAAARRVPGHVVGDGSRTIAELVAILNADPRRGAGHDNLLTRIELDAEALRLLATRDLAPDSVPAAGEHVYLRATANISTGGTAVDITNTVHRDVRATAVRAARAVGLDVAGVDYITPDATRPFGEVGGGVCEVNAAPGLRMHIRTGAGAVPDVASAIIDSLFPAGGSAVIPIAAITGTNGKTTTARMVAHIVASTGARVGLATSDGVYVAGQLTQQGDMTGPLSAQMVLRDVTVDVAVLETARGGLLRAGLAFRHCAVGAVLNVSRDHLGIGGIDTVEELAGLKRIVVEAAEDVAVLNADDPLCLAMAGHTVTRRTCLVSMRNDNRVVTEHLAAGYIAVILELDGESEFVVVAEGRNRTRVIEPREIPATLGGRARFNTQNALFATAIAYALGVQPPLIRAALRSFDTSFTRTPGRFNICDAHPFRVILDYGHNPAAVDAMGATAASIAPDARRICVLAAPGDRSDEDIRAVARAAAPYFHHFVCRHDVPLRGRAPAEVPRLLRQGLLEAGIEDAAIEVIHEEPHAIAAALRRGRHGDLLVIFCDAIEDAWRQVIGFRSVAPHQHTADPPSRPPSQPQVARYPGGLLRRQSPTDTPPEPDRERISP
jgi:cyanophycin synthetase